MNTTESSEHICPQWTAQQLPNLRCGMKYEINMPSRVALRHERMCDWGYPSQANVFGRVWYISICLMTVPQEGARNNLNHFLICSWLQLAPL